LPSVSRKSLLIFLMCEVLSITLYSM
jgi:hypothetical protein